VQRNAGLPRRLAIEPMLASRREYRRQWVMLRGLLLLALLSGTGQLTRAESSGGGSLSVTRTLSPEEFARAGLNKLTAEELAFLDAALARRQPPARPSKAAPPAAPAAIAQRGPAKGKIAAEFGAEQVAQAKPTNDGDELHTTIEGTVQEFSGRAVFVLGNGQIWQLRTPTDVFLPKKLVNPTVTLIRGAFGYKLVIDAADLVLLVKRVQ
jgi:hypothetical protein